MANSLQYCLPTTYKSLTMGPKERICGVGGGGITLSDVSQNRKQGSEMEPEGEINKVEEWIEENRLARALIEKSGLDKGVLKTLLLYYWSEDVTFEDLAQRLDLKKPGAWKRWRKGLDAITQSFYTIELAVYSGILDAETAKLLAEDLQDYVELTKEGGDIEAIRDRLEKRMVELRRQGF